MSDQPNPGAVEAQPGDAEHAESAAVEARPAAVDHTQVVDEEVHADDAQAKAADEPGEQTPIEQAIADAFHSTSDSTGFADALAERRIILARVTEADQATFSAPIVGVSPGDLVAVDEHGVTHMLNPDRPDAAAIEQRFNEPRVAEVQAPVPSVADAHAGFAAQYQPTPEKRFRDRLRSRLVNIRDQAVEGQNGDTRALANAVLSLIDLVHNDLLPQDDAADSLRAALASIASDKIDEAALELGEARDAMIEEIEAEGLSPADEPAFGQLDEAMQALQTGDRERCVKLLRSAVDYLTPNYRHQTNAADRQAAEKPAADPATNVF